jgi:hypothetical protein
MTPTVMRFTFGIPIAGIAAIHATSAWQLVLRDHEFMRLAGADYDLPLGALHDLASYGVFEEAVPHTIQFQVLDMS